MSTPLSGPADPTREAVDAALTRVIDPEIKRPITDLGMVEAVEIEGGLVRLTVLLTVAGCPSRGSPMST